MHRLVVEVLLLTILCSAATTRAIEAKCSACRAVASELQKRIDKEGVRNHLDLRHRLDAQGQRYGKVIAYKESELRAVELLDELCSTANKYTLGERNSSTGQMQKTWILVQGESSITIDGTVSLGGNEQQLYSRQLESYCGHILDEYEEDIMDVLKTDRFEDEGVPKVLCGEIVKHCNAEELVREAAAQAQEAPSEQQAAEADVPEAAAEEQPKEEL